MREAACAGKPNFSAKANNLSISREKKRKSIQVRGVHVALLLLLLTLVGYGVNRMTQFLLTWEQLRVKTFRLLSVPRYQGEQARAVLRQYRGNILTLDLAELKSRLLQLPEVLEVELSRVLPATVEVSFRLRQPLFQYYQNGAFIILDENGKELHRQDAADEGLIVIAHARPEEVPRIVGQAEALKRIRERLEYVGFSSPYGIELKVKGVAERIYPGEGDLAEKLDRYLRVRPKLALAEGTISYVDLRLDDRIYFATWEQGGVAHER